MREIIFDTETTGLNAREGDRIIEIGALEMINRFPTGRTFHEYLHPEDRAIHPDAQAVHGISIEKLKGMPTFADLWPKIQEFFFDDSVLIAHNADFDIGFFDAELKRIGQPVVDRDRVLDTLKMARRKFPGSKNSLDALCSRFGISNAHRTLHGALLDSELLADVYIELTGGRQEGLSLDQENTEIKTSTVQLDEEPVEIRTRAVPLPSRLTSEETAAHEALLDRMGEDAIWNKWKS